ncbi:uncharacterized protein LOC129777970 [Toxorhynchites rutilus septentrionalis]|uniref:uncharacterized protein LOC129777970 n=1 Tax=Toxorhynchites rutilus septentrionalis TaxID=329112 RepID=UPI00247A92FA|nr:uncharacterized protein LOC129777970 [Toxorhynchites rutilus septentrionalis]
MIFWKSALLSIAVLSNTAKAQLPHKVIEMKDSLFHEIQSLAEVIPENRFPHANTRESNVEVHRLLDEFLFLNQESIGSVLHVLKLVDHNMENVIQDCERVLNMCSLESTNVVFNHVTKPLLLKVRDLCELVATNRADEIEISLETIEREAATYRRTLDQTLKDISLVSGHLESDFFQANAQQREDLILGNLQQVNQTLSKEVDQYFTNFSTNWIGKYKNLTMLIPEGLSRDQPEINALYDFMEFLDNETSVLQDDLVEFMDYWSYLVEETLESVTNGTELIVDFLRDYPLEELLSGKTPLNCVALYYSNFEHIILNMLNEFYRCVEYELEMTKAFGQITSVLDPTDKAINFMLDSYITCAKLTGHFGDDFGLADCLEDLGELLDQTREFVEHKTSEIYYHVEDAMIFNGVIMGACVHMKARDTALQIAGKMQSFDNCSKSYKKASV